MIRINNSLNVVPNSLRNLDKALSVVCSGYFCLVSCQLLIPSTPKTNAFLTDSSFLRFVALTPAIFRSNTPAATC